MNQNNKSERAKKEEEVLSFWQKNNIFEKTLEKKSDKREYIFYEGPPTANGTPGIHHLEARAFKDVIPRYKTMKGYHVRRKGGWDTHGLPVELQVEKELGLASKKEVENYGISSFNQKCKESVWKYLDLWNDFTYRIGYWVDQKNPYVTYHNSYIESLWNVVNEINKKDLLFKDYKVVPWCARCGTALSSHELAQGYETVKDLSIYAKFKLKTGQKIKNFEVTGDTYVLAWTTTPWTLPGNVALAVGKDIEYILINLESENLIIAKERVSVISKEYEILLSFFGSDLINLSYEPLFPFLKYELEKDDEFKESRDRAFKIYEADFVTTTDGTGVVHTAVMYGQDDFELGTKVGLPKFHTVLENGRFITDTGFLDGRFVKEKDENGKPTLDVDIIKYLQDKNLFFNKELYEHSYPHCWRCKTPLVYYARDSWYIKMSSLRDELVKENQTINWEPSYIKNGRFGEWLSEIKDWAISRERYWGTPLPIWESEDGNRMIVSSIDDIKKYSKKSNNRYFLMRHGLTEGNVKQIWSVNKDFPDHLTSEGILGVKKSALEFKEKNINIDYVFASPFVRTKETLSILKEILNLKDDQIFEEEKIGEWNVGPHFDGKKIEEFLLWKYSNKKPYEAKMEGGESFKDLLKRMGNFIYDTDEKFSNKNILVISHGAPLKSIELISEGLSSEDEVYKLKNYNEFSNAEIREINFSRLPHDEYFELDLHKPYIDEIDLIKDGKSFKRVKEVMDVWFDSGCMPFAQDNYPFKNKEISYPADFISEAIDQTRGWFYTLHAVGILLGKGKAYKNVICLGHILDKDGKKMSKSLGNIVDPWSMIEKYGVDPLRFFMYTVNQPGESKNFDEKTVLDIERKVFNLIENVFTFYDLYRDKDLENNSGFKSENVLDKWIVALFNKTLKTVEGSIEEYKLLEAGREIREFVDGLSTWYIRRSRDRIKDKDKEALTTLYFILKSLSKIMAPFTPFIAESLYQNLKNENDKESVHLEDWPTSYEISGDIISDMKKVREVVTLGLESRQKLGIKVRQPLSLITIPEVNFNSDFQAIICDELNVKNIKEDKSIKDGVLLDTIITNELKEEGQIREFIRGIQELRKQKGLTPEKNISLLIETTPSFKEVIERFSFDIKKTVSANDLVFKTGGENEILIDNIKVLVSF
jgi:isoleucyl-tRNA synthetase